MNQQHETQVVLVIKQFEDKNKYVPYLHNLDNHHLYGDFFRWLSIDERDEVQEIITAYIKSWIQSLSTKWGEMFQRFYELHGDLFWDFRRLNWDEKNTWSNEFNQVWWEVERKLYHFEQILTKNMMKKPMWLEKVTDAYYTIAVRYFPFYYRIA
jgi:hypothetical protein